MSLSFESERGFGVYIHWPYCTRICPYCDFNVYAAKQRDTAPLLDAILQDIAHWRDWSGARRVDSVFFGGGTPSLMQPADISKVIATIDDHWGLAGAAEISLEANPDDVARFGDIRAAGVNRLSLGVQSLNDEALGFLGRTHDAASAMTAIRQARVHYGSLSLDFIYALPDQTLAAWRTELNEICQLDADHLSLYELTIEPGAAFAKAVERGNWQPADEDQSADLYDLTQDLTAQAGYAAYEISNHARDQAHQAQHNIVYWRSGDWVGVGPGAHGRLTAEGERWAVEALKRPPDYIAQVQAQKNGHLAPETLSARDLAQERLIMGLRLASGLAMSDVTLIQPDLLNMVKRQEFIELGWLKAQTDRLSLTSQGRLLADHIGAALIGDEI